MWVSLVRWRSGEGGEGERGSSDKMHLHELLHCTARSRICEGGEGVTVCVCEGEEGVCVLIYSIHSTFIVHAHISFQIQQSVC